jgi:hypothetical protein
MNFYYLIGLINLVLSAERELKSGGGGGGGGRGGGSSSSSGSGGSGSSSSGLSGGTSLFATKKVDSDGYTLTPGFKWFLIVILVLCVFVGGFLYFLEQILYLFREKKNVEQYLGIALARIVNIDLEANSSELV